MKELPICYGLTVSPQSHAKNLNLMVLGGEALMYVISSLIKQTQRALFLLPPDEDTARRWLSMK